MAQRWLVVSSQAALERAEASVNKAQQREEEASRSNSFTCKPNALRRPRPRKLLWRRWRIVALSPGEHLRLIAHKHYACKGRPTPTTPIKSIDWQIQAQGRPDHEKMERPQAPQRPALWWGRILRQPSERSRGDRGLQRASPSRGRLSVSQRPTVFCLVVVCEETLPDSRAADGDDLAPAGLFCGATPTAPTFGAPNETMPNQINQPTAAADLALGLPTARRDSSRPRDRARQVHDLIEGLNEVQIKILRLFGEEVCRLYQISPG